MNELDEAINSYAVIIAEDDKLEETDAELRENAVKNLIAEFPDEDVEDLTIRLDDMLEAYGVRKD